MNSIALYRRVVKPVSDRLLAGLGLLVLSPVLLLLSVAIRSRLGTPVIFRQLRIGMNDKPFEFLKFRTMRDERDAQGNLLPDGDRLTALGHFLRANSLDELPQLWNVLTGDMSLVGPRPLLPEYLPRYSSVQRRRHQVKPGITGVAQVSGRNALEWDEKFRLDVWYVDHCSFTADNRILWATLKAVLTRQGISKAGHATAPEFLGSPRG